MTKGGRDTGRFWDWFTNKAVTRSFSQADLTELDSIMTETHVRELAYYTCVGLIARMVSKCEFQTLSRGSPVRESEWYAWNVSPNANQNSSQFMSKLIHKLYSEQCAALVVDIGGQLLVADSYSLEERALADSVFSGITVDGYTLSDTLPASQVLYFKQTPYNMRMLTNLLYETYGKLISYNAKSYQASRARKGVLTFETQQSNKVEDAKQNMEILQQRFKPFMGSGDAVLPLYRGESYTDISGSKTYTQETTRDLRAMIDDVLTYDARALGIPPALIHGDIAGIRDAVSDLVHRPAVRYALRGDQPQAIWARGRPARRRCAHRHLVHTACGCRLRRAELGKAGVLRLVQRQRRARETRRAADRRTLGERTLYHKKLFGGARRWP